MRVIAGSAKGLRLASVPSGVRPVSDRVREALFSSLGAAVTGATVLDLYAGTGALGIEALSRGAEHAVFVERSHQAVAAIRENLRRTRLEDHGRVELGPVSRVMRDGHPDAPFDLVLVDPPYDAARREVEDVLAAVAGGLLAPDGTAVLTRPTRSSTLVIPVHWLTAKRLEHGDSTVLILRPEPREA